MTAESSDPSVQHEGFGERHDPHDHIDDEPALRGAQPVSDGGEAAEHNVWDEPATRAAGISAPQDAQTYARWYRDGLARTSPLHSWLVVAALALGGGVFAVFGSLFFERPTGYAAVIAMVVVAPLIEEMLKIGGAMIVLETRPYLFRGPAQLMLAVLASALMFAVLENILYLNLYIESPTEELRHWRWTVCLGMHLTATCIAGVGLVRTMQFSRAGLTKPRIQHAYPFIIAAVCLHGAYNLAGLAIEIAGSGAPSAE